MGQIITSLINFFLEVGRSNELYKTTKNKNRVVRALGLFMMGVFIVLAFEGFTTGYLSKVEVIELKDEVKKLQHLRYENESLKARNEVLSRTLSYYIGRSLVEKLNSPENLNPEKIGPLPKIDPDSDHIGGDIVIPTDKKSAPK